MGTNGMSEHDTCMVGAAEAWRGERPRPRRVPDRASASGLLTYAEAGEANTATRAINIDARIIVFVSLPLFSSLYVQFLSIYASSPAADHQVRSSSLSTCDHTKTAAVQNAAFTVRCCDFSRCHAGANGLRHDT